MDTNTIEAALLKRELENISEELKAVGAKLYNIFDKYGTINGRHAEELHEYIVTHVLSVVEPYYAGHKTVPRINANPDHVPDCIKELVLKWAVDDFFSKFNEIESVVADPDSPAE